MLSEDLSFHELIESLRRRWPWLLAAFVVGALAGMLAGLLIPPRVLATASLGIGLDYARSQPLTAEQERLALLQVQELVLSDETLNRVIELQSAQGAQVAFESAAALRQQLRLDEYENRWDLIVAAGSGAEAERWADAWSLAAVEALEAALAHALRAQELQAQLYDLSCQLVPPNDQDQVLWQCETGEPDPEGSQMPEELVAEIQQSHGIVPALTFARLRSGEGSAQVTRPAVPWLALAGATAGGAWMLIILLWRGDRPAERLGPERDRLGSEYR